MKKYDLVICDDPQALIALVNEAITIGYYPKGGMTHIHNKCIQAIYLRDQESEGRIKELEEVLQEIIDKNNHESTASDFDKHFAIGKGIAVLLLNSKK